MTKADVAKERKSQIVKATVECIANFGYHNFSMQDVAKAAGVSKGIIHYYFLNKDDLMMSVLDKVASDIDAVLHADMESIDSPEEKLQVLVGICLNVIRNTREYYQVNMDFWTQINQKEDVKLVIAKHYANFRETCSQVLVQGIDAGVFADVDVGEYSSFIIAVIDGISLQWLFDENVFDYDKISQRVTKLIMDGLKP